MLEINNTNHPLNSIFLLKERLIKVETLFEKYASLTKKYNDLEKLHHQSVENEKKAKKDATKYLEKYCKLSKKCDTLSYEIENYEDALKKKTNALEEVRIEYERIESLLQMYKQERSVLKNSSPDNINKDKDFLLSSTWRLFKESDRNKNRLAIAIFFKRFKNDLENLKLEDFRNIKSDQNSKSSAHEETKEVLNSHEKQIVNNGKINSIRNDSAADSAKIVPLGQNKECCTFEKCMHLEQQDYTAGICTKLDQLSTIKNDDFLNFNTNLEPSDSLSSLFYDTPDMKSKENSSLYECSAVNKYSKIQNLEESHVTQNISNDIKNEIPESANELCRMKDKADYSIQSNKNNHYNNHEKLFISSVINNIPNRMQNSEELIDRKLTSNYNSSKITVLNHNNKTDLDFLINKSLVNCKTYKKNSKKSPMLDIKLEKNLPVSCENIDYIGNPSGVIMLNTDIIKGDLKISSDLFGENNFNLTGFNSFDESKPPKNKIPKSMSTFIGENEKNRQAENIMVNNQTLGRCNSIFSIENETFKTKETEKKSFCEEVQTFSLEFGVENKSTVSTNTLKIVPENIVEKDGKLKSNLEDFEKTHENDFKNENKNSGFNAHICGQTEVYEAKCEGNNINKSNDSRKFIESSKSISDQEINKIFQTFVHVPLLSPIKDAENIKQKQKKNIKHKQKEMINNSNFSVNSEKNNEVITKTSPDIIHISVSDISSKDCRKINNQSSPKNKLIDFKNISLKEKMTEDKFVQTDAIKDMLKEKFVQCSKTCVKLRKLPVALDKLILKIFRKMKKEILLKSQSPKKRKVFDKFVKRCKDHCMCLDFVLLLLKILNLPKLNYDKMIKFTVKILKMMKIKEFKVQKKATKKKIIKSLWKSEKEKGISLVTKQNHAINSFIVPEIKNVNKLYPVNEHNSLNSVAREIECVNVIHHVIHRPYNLISPNKMEVLQRIQPFNFFSQIPQEVQIFNNNCGINFSEKNLRSEALIENNTQIAFDKYKQENNNYINCDDWVDAIIPKNNFVMMNKKIELDFLKAENSNSKSSAPTLEYYNKKNVEFAPTKIFELNNILNSSLMKNSGIENSNKELKLANNSSSSNNSSTLSNIKNSENKLCNGAKLGTHFDGDIKNFLDGDRCLDKIDLKENPINGSKSKGEELIQILKNDSKLESKKESLLVDVEEEREPEEPFTFEEKDFYTPPIVSPFESDVLGTEDEELDYSLSTSYSYKNTESTTKCNTFEYDQSEVESKLYVAVKQLSTSRKQNNSDSNRNKTSDQNSVFKIQRETSNKMHEKLDETENISQDCSLNKKRRISHEHFGSSCKSSFENKNFENSKPRKKVVQRKNLKNLPLKVDEIEQDMERESSANFLDSILSAMTKQAEYFKATVPVSQVCDMNAVSSSAQQTSLSNFSDNSKLEQKQENEILKSNTSSNSDFNHTVNTTERFQNECHAGNVTRGKIFQSSINHNAEMKRLVEKVIKDFLKVEINSTIEAEEKMKHCIAVLGKAEKSIISKVIVSEIMANVDEELQEFDRPAPPLTKTQHRLICILTVLTESNNQFSSVSNNILKVIRSKIFPENFFWPDDSLETATRFYTALCKKLNNFKEIWKFCFKALTHMRQRWSIVIYVVLQTWPDILHDATKVKDNILVNTFVNLILHSPKSEECRRKRQQNRLLALKHLLKNFYEFEINCTMEDFTKQIFELFFTDTLGADKALMLISKCKDWCWTKKHIIPKLSETVIAWADGNVDEIIGKKSLQIIHQICWDIPKTDETINSATEVMISGLQKLLNSKNLNQISKEKVIKILCELKHHDNVREILSSSLEQFSYNIGVFKKIQNAILLPNTENNLRQEIRVKKDQNKLIKTKLKRKKKNKKKHSNSKAQEHLNPCKKNF